MDLAAASVFRLNRKKKQKEKLDLDTVQQNLNPKLGLQWSSVRGEH